MYADAGGSCRWRLVAPNNQTIGTSHQSFSSKASCRRAVNRINRNFCARVIDNYPG
ncbi:MAG: YegP family protein [Amphiplicatus sp.]